MTRLIAALFLLLLAALLAAVGYVLARPRWRWDWPEERELCRDAGCWGDLGHDGPHREIDGTQWSSAGSPDSVTTNDGKRTCDLCLICVGCRVGHVHCRPCRCAATCTTDPESVTWSVYNGEGLFV